jgi:hypothetical protein
VGVSSVLPRRVFNKRTSERIEKANGMCVI